GKEMKLTHLTMVVGGLSLAGLIPLSGFWSKDMILAEGLHELGGPGTVPLVLLVLTAFLTAAYTFRMLNLVFWGKSQRSKAAHEAPWQMSVPLLILMVGAVISWIAVGFLVRAYASFFPWVHGIDLAGFIVETLSTPAVALSVIAFFLGIGLFYVRRAYAHSAFGRGSIALASAGYGFDRFYRGIVLGLKEFAIRFRRTHTGDLNINMAGIAIGILILIAVVLLLGGA
ncbi:MAG: hypothetical protein AB1665_03950, partial [Candidatus Thermoplasmatota archaeon]